MVGARKIKSRPLKIGIIGAGFSGTALAANLHRLSKRPIEIYLFDRTGEFGLGEAYRTPYPFHLLNVRAHDMSAFEGDRNHFVDWLQATFSAEEFATYTTHFAPRLLYGKYLKDLLTKIQCDETITFKTITDEVIDIIPQENTAQLILKNNTAIAVDKVVLALGNNPPSNFPFPVSADTQCIRNPWDYTALEKISSQDPVFIVGTGLSMIDTVLTLYHQKHQGPIYALSRHGLLPLPHATQPDQLTPTMDEFNSNMRVITQRLRKKSKHYLEQGGDWRSCINILRPQIPSIWRKASLSDKKQFLRHLVSYWNIHRHRVPEQVIHLFTELSNKQQLKILSGRVVSVAVNNATIQLRKLNELSTISMRWLINCMGPALHLSSDHQHLIKHLLARNLVSLDPLKIGFNLAETGALLSANGEVSPFLYTLGPPAKSAYWECSAVPEIRKQCQDLALQILAIN